MVINSEKNDIKNGPDMSSEELFNKRRRRIEIFSIIALFSLIASILLISIDLELIAGILIVVSASLGIAVFRNIMVLNIGYKESLSELSLSNKKKDDVINDFSHKIREPLNSLVSIVDILLESDLKQKQKELIETFSASTNNMVSTVNELTMKSAGNLSFEKRKNIRFNIASTIDNTIDLYSLKGKVKIEFLFDKNEFNKFECLGDPIVLKQIFLDLFNTIEKHSNERVSNVKINLKKAKETNSGNLFSLSIHTDSTIEIINETGPEERSLSAQLISSCKGTFSQESGSDYTILNILLPFSFHDTEPKQATVSHKVEELIKKEKTKKELKDLKILLVEDNLINQKITLLTLKPLVHSIDTASNGKEALDKFGTSNYDLILMDIQMPVMNGLIAAEKIRALESTLNSHIPIIAITANAMIGDKEKCLSSGIDDYISKPFKPSALVDKITPFF